MPTVPQAGQVWRPTRPGSRTAARVVVGVGSRGEVESVQEGSRWSATLCWSSGRWDRWVAVNAAACETAAPDEVRRHQGALNSSGSIFEGP